MLMTQVDEALDVNPTVTLTEKELMLAAVKEINVGSEFTMTCKVVCKEITEATAENGMPESTAVMELSRITLEGDEKPKSAIARFYNNSHMNDPA